MCVAAKPGSAARARRAARTPRPQTDRAHSSCRRAPRRARSRRPACGEQRAQVVRHDARHVGVHDQDRAGIDTGERSRHRRPLAAARIARRRRPRARGRGRLPSSSPVTTRGSPIARAAARTSPSIASDSARRRAESACSRVLPSTPANGMTTVGMGKRLAAWTTTRSHRHSTPTRHCSTSPARANYSVRPNRRAAVLVRERRA